MDFRDRLVGTLRAAQPLFEVEGVVVVGSEVPNLLEVGAAATLVVSQDLDVGVPVVRIAEVKARFPALRAAGFTPSTDEPSVWLPADPRWLELNFLGLDPATREASETYVLEDAELPLMVFGPLGLVTRGPSVDVDGMSVPLPRPAGLALEKLLSDRSGDKGDRDALVVLGLLMVMAPAAVDELVALIGDLPADARHTVASNLTLLSLIERRPGMPDPVAGRSAVRALLERVRS